MELLCIKPKLKFPYDTFRARKVDGLEHRYKTASFSPSKQLRIHLLAEHKQNTREKGWRLGIEYVYLGSLARCSIRPLNSERSDRNPNLFFPSSNTIRCMCEELF